MRLTRLQAKDFLGLKEVDIDLSRPVNLLIGVNGSGKTSTRDAVQWVLAGRCRSTDAAGRNADSLIRRGTTECRVALEWQDGDQVFRVERSRNGAGSRGPKEPAAEPDLIQALLDMPHLLRLSAKERSEVLSAVISPAVSLVEIRRHAGEIHLSPGAVSALCTGLERIAPGPYGPAELAEAYRRCYEARKERKRELAELKGKLQGLPAATAATASIGDVQSKLEAIEAVEASVREKIGALRQKQAEWSQARARWDELKAQLAAMVPQEEAAPQGAIALEPSIDGLEREAARLAEVHANHKEIHKIAYEKRVQAETEADAAVKRADQAVAGDTSCPAGVTSDPCPILKERAGENQKQVEQLVTVSKKLWTAAKKACAAELKAGSELDAAAEALHHAEGLLAAAREASARDEGSKEASADAIQAELDRIEEQYPADAMSPIGEIESTKGRLEAVLARKSEAQGRLRDIEASERFAGERKDLQGKVADAGATVAILEELVPALEPRGLPARLLAEKIGPVEARINAQLATITGGEYRVAIRAERGVDLDVYRGGSNLALPPENLSMSERLRLGVALAQAVSIISGLRILVVDEAEMLDSSNRTFLMRGIEALAGQIETTLILATVDRPATATTDDMGVFWVENGTVVPVVATLPAEVV